MNELWFIAETKPMDLVTFNIKKLKSTKVPPQPSLDETISNAYYNVTFGTKGLATINGVNVGNDLLYFNSSQGYGQNSGAYIFRPNKTDPDIINAAPKGGCIN